VLVCAWVAPLTRDRPTATVETSPEFEEFLDFLGDRVELQDWKQFRGGLDATSTCIHVVVLGSLSLSLSLTDCCTVDGSTGTHSVFTVWNNNEIMFHVSTLLPFNPLDKQQLERKRHIGNDIVVIIYQDGDTIYRPTTVSSRQIHVVLLVKSCVIDGERHYRYAALSLSLARSLSLSLSL